VTGYGLDGPRIESRWGGGEIFSTRPDRPWGPTSHLYNGYRVFFGGKIGQGVVLIIHPLLVPRSRKSTAIPLPPPSPLWAFGSVTGYLYLTYHCVTIAYSIHYSNILYRFVAYPI
jgi:hypothetical protein